MILGFIIGLFAGVIIMAIVQVNLLNRDLVDNFQKMTEEEPTSHSSDCFNDTETNNDIPRIN